MKSLIFLVVCSVVVFSFMEQVDAKKRQKREISLATESEKAPDEDIVVEASVTTESGKAAPDEDIVIETTISTKSENAGPDEDILIEPVDASKPEKCKISITTASGTARPVGDICAGALIFEDDFNDFDTSKWGHENTLAGGGNWEFQWYTNNRSNSYTEDGILYIRPTLTAVDYGEDFLTSGTIVVDREPPFEPCSNAADYGCERRGTTQNIVNPIRSASLRTLHSFSFLYGRVEIKAKLPSGDWLWPALWFKPTHNAYGPWPASGEIDLMESRGNRNFVVNGVNIGAEQVGSTLHFGPNPNLNAYPTSTYTKNSDPGNGYNLDFHRYQMEWNKTHIQFSIDDVELATIPSDFWARGGFAQTAPGVKNPWRNGSPMAPFDQEFYLIINLAVGGIAYFPDGGSNPDEKPWSNKSPQAATDFWNGRQKWLPTWNLNANHSKEASLQVDYVRVWAAPDEDLVVETNVATESEKAAPDEDIVTEQAEASKPEKCKISITTASGTARPVGDICAGALIFEDDFNDFDTSKWGHENTLAGGGNWEFQWYTNNRSNSYTEDGILYIRPTLTADDYGEDFLTSGTIVIDREPPFEPCTNAADYGCERRGTTQHIVNPIRSANLRTIHSFSFLYGRVEIKAKLPSGDWLWPALWFKPTHNVYGPWPASGEIDLMESRGNRNFVVNGVNIGAEQVGSTLHFGPNPNLNAYPTSTYTKNSEPGNGYNLDFHRYQMEWNKTHIRFSIDDVELATIPSDFWARGGFAQTAPGVKNPWRNGSPMAPFDQEFYLIINLAVGGIAYFPDGGSNPDEKPWSNKSPQAATDFWTGRQQWLPTWNLTANHSKEASLQVDYVRVWAL